MCRVMMIAGIKPQHVEKAHELTKFMAKEIAWHEPDGVGYAAITKDCQIYGEKWLDKDHSFVLHSASKADPIVERITEQFGNDAIEYEKEPPKAGGYAVFGNPSPANIANTVAVILHARRATKGGKTIENVHPFMLAGQDGEPSATALIHNGSIDNHEKLKKTMSSCDSEVILHEYLGLCMYHNPFGMRDLAKTLVGSYTVGVLSSSLEKIDGKEVWVPYLDIFKSNKELIGGYVPEIETFVFTTFQTNLEEAVKKANMSVKYIFKVKDGFLHRINAITGEKTDFDRVSFATSARHWNEQYNRAHEHSSTVSRLPARNDDGEMMPFGPRQDATQYDDGVTSTDGDADAMKKVFERRHPELFTTPYLEGNLNDLEKNFFETLKTDNKTDHAALRLVSAALNIGR